MGMCEVVFLEDGDLDKDETKEVVDRERFTKQVERKLVPKLGNYLLDKKHTFVILDNATIHHSEKILRLITDAGAKTTYLHPYSPYLNPIELMFEIYKKYMDLFLIKFYQCCYLKHFPKTGKPFDKDI